MLEDLQESFRRKFILKDLIVMDVPLNEKEYHDIKLNNEFGMLIQIKTLDKKRTNYHNINRAQWFVKNDDGIAELIMESGSNRKTVLPIFKIRECIIDTQNFKYENNGKTTRT